MPIVLGLSVIAVALAGIYLVAFGVVALLEPVRATEFLNGFARSAAVHYLELAIRILAGAAFVVTAPRLLFSDMFFVFGWTLVLTTMVLAVLPWRWHKAFAARGVPYAVRYLPAVGCGAIVLGAAVLVSLIFS